MSQSRETRSPDFEESLAELEKIVERMERGEQTLDETINDFERGMALSEQCQKSLSEAKQKVRKLVEKHGNFKLDPLDDSAQDEYGDTK
ncbi:MAG: exodeoxyribonuclease VII small subunit [Gammaproteobacteria bacterium]|nr:exodeoxyribonuclease VII small subunit [Gammaproteobacteria bacterium]